MNRLVIIGNGFDLAHGLPTSYGHFINDYWSFVIKTIKKDFFYDDELITIDLTVMKYITFSMNNPNSIESFDDIIDFVGKTEDCSLDFKNDFFYKICDVNQIQNWVDIEEEYYNSLMVLTQNFKKFERTTNAKRKSIIMKLNNEFHQVQDKLEKYLQNEVLNQYNLKITNDDNSIFNIFLPKELTKIDFKNYLNEFPVDDEDEARRNMNMILKKNNDKHIDIAEEVTYHLCFLNFNYTPISGLYIDEIRKTRWSQSEVINIHGEIFNSENPIIFGFGDEMDEHYKIIENINDNEYLRYIKSFQYLNKSNYKKLLDFINQFGKFQLYIIGHSCGLSDRILLNTIFEHKNCRSIKVFYHQRPDGSDNYTEIIQNISRHFNDKKIMREKIVNKTYCQPLPQIQLPKKQ